MRPLIYPMHQTLYQKYPSFRSESWLYLVYFMPFLYFQRRRRPCYILGEHDLKKKIQIISQWLKKMTTLLSLNVSLHESSLGADCRDFPEFFSQWFFLNDGDVAHMDHLVTVLSSWLALPLASGTFTFTSDRARYILLQ